MKEFYSNNNQELLTTIHKLNAIEGKLVDFSDDDVIMEYVIEKKQRDDFHIKQDPEQKCCSTLVCRICGNDKFTVGQKEYFTAMSCENCGYQVGIHEG